MKKDMKSNWKFKRNLRDDSFGYAKVITSILALLLMVIIGVMTYWETVDSVDSFAEVEETFSEDADGSTFVALTSNASAWEVELDNSPVSSSNLNITCYNSSTKTESYPTFTLSHKDVSVAADAADYFDQVNATYTSNMADTEAGVSDMATTVFDLAPIIALALVASVLIGVIMAFGGGGKKL